jgi:hypothetical protein
MDEEQGKEQARIRITVRRSAASRIDAIAERLGVSELYAQSLAFGLGLNILEAVVDPRNIARSIRTGEDLPGGFKIGE